jgi:hypothetical protein
MATTSATTYTHTCDLCHEEREKAELTTVYSESYSVGGQRFQQAAQAGVDVCPKCAADKPISEVLALFAAKMARAK